MRIPDFLCSPAPSNWNGASSGLLHRLQESEDVRDLIVGQDAGPAWHPLGHAADCNGCREHLVELVAVAMMQLAQIASALALDRVGPVAVRAVLIEELVPGCRIAVVPLPRRDDRSLARRSRGSLVGRHGGDIGSRPPPRAAGGR